MPSFIITPALKIILAIAALAILLALVGPAACNHFRSKALQQRVDQGQQQAAGNSAIDAVRTEGNVMTNEAASANLTRTNTEEIKNAKGADVHVDPAVQLAGLRALCRRPSYRDSERCRLLQPHTP